MNVQVDDTVYNIHYVYGPRVPISVVACQFGQLDEIGLGNATFWRCPRP